MMKGRITRLWLSMVKVSDLERAVTFYQEILGLPLALDARMFNHIEVGPQEPLAKIGLQSTRDLSKRKKQTGIVLDTDDIHALFHRLLKKGVTFTLKPTKMPWGGVVANFLDPDNNELQVVQDPDHYIRKHSRV
jgi:predicted enzyme related to lactoylglutathione lyase